jgi:hypothetical protein
MSPRIGSSLLPIPMPGTDIRPPPTAFTATTAHVAVDPDPQIVIATTVTAGNSGDAEAAESLPDQGVAGTGR